MLPACLARGTRRGTARVNIGTDELGSLNPGKVGSRIRATCELTSAKRMREIAVQAVVRVTVEIEGETELACAVDMMADNI